MRWSRSSTAETYPTGGVADAARLAELAIGICLGNVAKDTLDRITLPRPAGL